VGPRVVFIFDVMCFGASQALFSRDLKLCSSCDNYPLTDDLEMEV
jgi:hypothetical protein